MRIQEAGSLCYVHLDCRMGEGALLKHLHSVTIFTFLWRRVEGEILLRLLVHSAPKTVAF
jgi:hypothetical protein